MPPPPVLLRLTASLPKAGIAVQLGPADSSELTRLEAILSGAVFAMAEDNEVIVVCCFGELKEGASSDK